MPSLDRREGEGWERVREKVRDRVRERERERERERAKALFESSQVMKLNRMITTEWKRMK